MAVDDCDIVDVAVVENDAEPVAVCDRVRVAVPVEDLDRVADGDLDEVPVLLGVAVWVEDIVEVWVEEAVDDIVVENEPEPVAV